MVYKQWKLDTLTFPWLSYATILTQPSRIYHSECFNVVGYAASHSSATSVASVAIQRFEPLLPRPSPISDRRDERIQYQLLGEVSTRYSSGDSQSPPSMSMFTLPSQSTRTFTKRVLQWSRIKLVYQRITLTKYTTLFFFLSLINCLVLIILQSIAFADNQAASEIISSFLVQGNITETKIVYLSGDDLYECSNIPGREEANCSLLVSGNGSGSGMMIMSGMNGTNDRRGLDGVSLLESKSGMFRNVDLEQRHHKEHAKTVMDSNGQIDGLLLDNGQFLDQTCLQSLIWLNEVIRDSMAEDIVTLTFQVWLLLLSFVTILNESLPHLGSSIAGHVLVTGWAGYRLNNTVKLQRHYQTLIVHQACGGADFLGGWWEVRMGHTIPILVFNTVALVAATYLASRLYKVYAQQSFNRVGASSQIHNVYKLVLVLSVCVQLGGFFAIASTAMWLDKASSGTIKSVAMHLALYRAVFVAMGALELPWAILGWTSVRHENRRQFIVFAGISLLLLASSSGIFASPLYRFIFRTWPFFATMTITSYLLIVLTTILGIWCRANFGRGLPEFLREREIPEGADFDPVYYAPAKFRNKTRNSVNSLEKDSEKNSFDNDDESNSQSQFLPYLPAAVAPVQKVQAIVTVSVKKPPRAIFSNFHPRLSRFSKSSSVYSDMNRGTVKISSTPPLFRDTFISMRTSLSLSSVVGDPPGLATPSAPEFTGRAGEITTRTGRTERARGFDPTSSSLTLGRSSSDRTRFGKNGLPGLPRNPRSSKN
ncbi:hypothetical protein GGU11DRAFT_760243 [Lentinula aff. detonsa]|nr:hypothetical protein GGU11DRAFT_760243 [Lentinula aff. detonsa]